MASSTSTETFKSYLSAISERLEKSSSRSRSFIIIVFIYGHEGITMLCYDVFDVFENRISSDVIASPMARAIANVLTF